MTIGNYTLNQFTHQLGKYQHQVNLVLVILLSIYLLAYAADLTWRLIPAPQEANQPQQTQIITNNKTAKNTDRANLAAIVALDLFGSVRPAAPVANQQVTEAPKTRLNLKLTGVVASSNSKAGAAIIENKGIQNTYGIGDKIDGTNAVLAEVYAERVIIKNGARHETLMLDGVDYTKTAPAPAKQLTASKTKEPSQQRRKLSADAVRATRNVRSSPASFTHFIAISPVRKNGKMQGYRVSPGKDPSLFKAAGLKPGDIITDINGLDLTDLQQSMEAMNALQRAQSLQITINRNNEVISLFLDIPTNESES